MRRAITRITRPLCRPISHPSLLIARRQFSVSAPQAETSFHDRLRRKIWGTDTPAEPPTTTLEKVEEKVEEEEEEEEEDRKGYVEAVDARELRVVGLESGLQEWDLPVFTVNTKFESPESLVRAVHRAIVEIHTLTFNNYLAVIPYTGPENLSDNVLITVAPSGSATFNYQLPEIEDAILNGKGTEHMEIRPYTEEEVYPALEERPAWLDEGLEKTGWANLQLRSEVLFDVVKRVMQLTGRRIPDPEVSKMKTVADLLGYLELKPKPTKLYDVLAESDLPKIPNVKVFGSRVRPWDKERAIGRDRPFEKVVEFKYPFEVQVRK